MFKQLFLPLIAVGAFIALVGLLVQGKIGNFNKVLGPSSTPKPNIVKIDDTEIKVEVAKTDQERQRGLGGRTSLDQNSGMLFVMPSNSKPSFWMKDTLIPLDIIWIKNGKVIGVEKDVPVEKGVEDSKLKLYPAPGVVDYVLEVNAGFSDKNNITVGQNLSGLEQLLGQ